jgi:hypothetical protein
MAMFQNQQRIKKNKAITPNPFTNFTHLYSKHKSQPLDSTFLNPGKTKKIISSTTTSG